MDVTFINPFIASMQTAFSSMLSCKITRQKIYLGEEFRGHHEVTGVIGLTGQVTGNVVLSFDREVAISATEALLGERPKDVDADVIDAAGELVNIVAGGAKTQLSSYQLELALPTVVVGEGSMISFESNVRPVCIPFDCPWGELSLEVGFC